MTEEVNKIQPEDEERIIETFRKLRKRQLIVTIPLMAIAIIAILQAKGGMTITSISNDVMMPVFWVAIAVMAVFSIINWKCPACNRYLGRDFNPRHCQYCGVKLKRN